MKVYHSSGVIVENPDADHSRTTLDFGKGFYFTTLRLQAEKYAQKFIKYSKPAYLNMYEFNEDLSDWKVKTFDSYNEEWLNFVMDCRSGKEQNQYDVIIGGIANDKVFDTLTLYFEELIAKQEALHRLIYEEPNIQYCISCNALIKQNLSFIEAVKLS